MWRLCTASLLRVAGSVTSARVPASLPVPAVVGTCTSAHSPVHPFRPDHVGERLAAARQDRGELCEVHGTAAAEADDEVGASRLGQREQRVEVGHVRLRLDLAEDGDLARQAERVDATRVGSRR